MEGEYKRKHVKTLKDAGIRLISQKERPETFQYVLPQFIELEYFQSLKVISTTDLTAGMQEIVDLMDETELKVE